jgi:GTP-binding protein
MFVDKAQVSVKAGDGGNGAVSFRHEIYVDRGGPDGGDGGKGGDVVLVASRNQDTLAAFRYSRLIVAENGLNGSKQKKRGRSADDLIVPLPVGTIVFDADGNQLADLTEDNQQVIIAAGGNGGFGNAHFISSVRQAPRIAELGEKGEVMELTFELRMLADVGLVGLPNAGKSSFLTAVSNARPEIADYPFTTLTPHLGVVDVGGDSLLIADIPGLIEGASEGKGLGDEFLRHVSRCSVLLHLIDCTQDDIAGNYKTIRGELKAYSKELAAKPEIIALTKIDQLTPDLVEMQLEALAAVAPKKSKQFAISSYAKRGLDELLFELKKVSVAQKKKDAKKEEKLEADTTVITLTKKPDSWKAVRRDEKSFIVTGHKIEKFAHRTDFENEQGVHRLRDILKKMAIMNSLRKQGINPDDTIIIGDPKIGSLKY